MVESWRLQHRPELDALRGVAIVLVVASHALAPHYMLAGAVGVSVFFALSGFLITSLLLEERDRSGRIDTWGFYRRRARRLLPALVVFLAAMLALGLSTGLAFATTRSVWPPLLYVENFARVGNASPDALGHTWSLSVEEQFYLVWPVVLVLLLRRGSARRVLAVAASVAVLSVLVRLSLLAQGAGESRIYYATDTNACLLLMGCALAASMAVGGYGARPRLLVVSLGLAALVLLGILPANTAWRAVAPVVAGIITVALLWLVARSGPGCLPVPRWLAHVGRRSYGLYLWHYPLLWVILPWLVLPRLVALPVLLAASWGLTWLSWRYVEEPFQRRRSPAVTVVPASEAPPVRAALGTQPEVATS